MLDKYILLLLLFTNHQNIKHTKTLYPPYTNIVPTATEFISDLFRYTDQSYITQTAYQDVKPVSYIDYTSVTCFINSSSFAKFYLSIQNWVTSVC